MQRLTNGEQERGDYRISTDPGLLDVDAVHAYLARSYWARRHSRDLCARLRGSLCSACFEKNLQVGLARVVTDRATSRTWPMSTCSKSIGGVGLGKWLMEVVVAHADLQGLRRFVLATRDAHGLYTKFDFTPLGHPEFFMEINPTRFSTRRVRLR